MVEKAASCALTLIKLGIMMKKICFAGLALLLAGCSGSRVWLAKDAQAWESAAMPDSKVSSTLFLVGDAGKAEGSDHVMGPLEDLLASHSPDVLVYLGDNLYPYGLRPEAHPDRRTDERHLRAQVDAASQHAEQVVFIPGNHDWEQGGREGFANLQRAEAFVEGYADRGAFDWSPDGGCPGPVEYALGERATLIVLDTQWWLHPYHKPGDSSDCLARDEAALLAELRAALQRNADKQVVVVGHHPMHSYGAHGGKYPWYTHLFPLTMVKKKAFVPLPILGTVAVLYRKLHGNIQDIPHPAYQHMRESLLPVFAEHPNLLYACGHDHNLQHLNVEGRDFIVSGAGSKTTYVGKGPQALLTTAQPGLVQVDFLENGQAWATFHTYSKEGGHEVVYRTRIFTGENR